ncbi:hypothetical protein Tco_0323180 [Tanacetum coccineum]
MGYLVRAYYSISSTRYYKDDSCWNTDLKSKTTEYIISIGSFMEVLVLNHYVLVRKIFSNNVLKTFSILFKFASIGFALGIGVTFDVVLEDEYGELAFEEFSEDIKEDEKYFCSAEISFCGTKSS